MLTMLDSCAAAFDVLSLSVPASPAIQETSCLVMINPQSDLSAGRIQISVLWALSDPPVPLHLEPSRGEPSMLSSLPSSLES